MQVLKFGGTSVANAQSMGQCADIISKAVSKDRTIVIASAISGFTDALIRVGNLAADKDKSYKDILDEFKERALDQYGPLTYRVLTEWGVTCCEDIGEMMFNLTEFKRVGRDKDDTPESFVGGYDFEETFLGPYST